MANKEIAKNLRVDIMRKQIETKNALTRKGDFYVGTGTFTDYNGGNVRVYTNTTSGGMNIEMVHYDSGLYPDEFLSEAIRLDHIIGIVESKNYSDDADVDKSYVIAADENKNVARSQITVNMIESEALAQIYSGAASSAISPMASRYGTYLVSAGDIINKQILNYNDTLHLFDHIPRKYFDGCGYLSEASFPVCTKIGSSAFAYCSALTSLTLNAWTGTDTGSIFGGGYHQGSSTLNLYIPAVTLCNQDFWSHIAYQKSINIYAPNCSLVQSTNTTPSITGFFADPDNNVNISQAIGDYAFSGRRYLCSVVMPGCVTVGSHAFDGCTSLVNAQFSNCQNIGECAFRSTAISAVEEMTYCGAIGASAYASCSSLQTVSFPTCHTVGNEAFLNCKSLQSAFFSANNINTVFMGSSVFQGCTSLSIASIDNCPAIGSYAFNNCTNLRSATINFTGLTALSYLGSGLFNGCSNLSSVIIRGWSGINYGKIFSGWSTEHTSLYLRIQTRDTNALTSNIMEALSIPSPVNFYDENCQYISIGMSTYMPKITAFSGSANTTAASRYIGSYAFYGCGDLSSISMPGCASIYKFAFGYCSALKSASFPVCKSIGSFAFTNCNNLSLINFPQCTTIGEQAFAECNSLGPSISFENCTYIGTSAFVGCRSLKHISFPSCGSIGPEAFAYCRWLSSASFPYCGSVGSSTFIACSALSEVYIDGCNAVGSYAFAGCTALTRCDFNTASGGHNGKLSSIGEGIFNGCDSLSILKLKYWNGSVDGNLFVGWSSNHPALSLYWYNQSLTNWTLNVGQLSHLSLSSPISFTMEGCDCIETNDGANIFYNYMSRISNFKGRVVGSAYGVNRYVGSAAFCSCQELTNFSMNGCSCVYRSAFYDCVNLSSVTSLQRCAQIHRGAFYRCTMLSSISLPACSYIADGGAGDGAFEGCGLYSISLPACEKIGAWAFEGCDSLSVAYLGSKCSEIGNYGFYGCTSLHSLYLKYSASMVSYGYYALNNTNNPTIYVPNSLVDTYRNDANWGQFTISAI